MCGFSGFFKIDKALSREDMTDSVRAMASTLQHRGPDDSGEWVDESCGIALGFRRLSILDLSAAGHQPMISRSGRFVIAFNGEIYNFRRIRLELESIDSNTQFRGQSDTEVLLAAIEEWGLEDAVQKFVGMFAFALWDRAEKNLHLVRDRIGVKPLYYGWQDRALLFGSELKSLKAWPRFSGAIDRDALALLLKYNYIPAPLSIYKGFKKLQPGSVLTIDDAGREHQTNYWSPKAIAEEGLLNPFDGTAEEAENELEKLLSDSIKLRMISDVPLGVFLSGGVDSSLVAAMMQVQAGGAVKSFTIGFEESDYNEAEHAREVARHLGTEHTELLLTSAETMAVIPKLSSIYDEPFSDSSQIPTHLVSVLARRHVKVALSGDGGDELFGGYNRHLWGHRIWKSVRGVPRPLRSLAGKVLKLGPPLWWDAVSRPAQAFLPMKLRPRMVGDKIHKLADVLDVRTPEEMYWRFRSHHHESSNLVRGGGEPAIPLGGHRGLPNFSDFTSRMMYLDLVTYLPDDILVKVDRASMAVGLEAREPLLDHRLVEFAWRLPLHMKVRDGRGKWLLRRVLYKHVPQAMIDRPKMGFGIPIGQWLRGPLRDWAEDLLSERRLRSEGYLNAEPIRLLWQQHLKGVRNWQYHLWDVLMFQSWLKDNRDVRQVDSVATINCEE